MLVTNPAIGTEARKLMQSRLEEHFKFSEGDDLASVVSEVLNDRELFIFLAAYLPHEKGIGLGTMSYWDDTTVNVVYGLTIDFDKVPRKTGIFCYESLPGILQMKKIVRILNGFPDYSQKDAVNPSPKEFADCVNMVLKEPERYVLDLKSDSEKEL